MRARRHQIMFDRLDTRLVLSAGASATSPGNIAALVAPLAGSSSNQMSNDDIPDPGLGGVGDSGTGGSTIPDPGLGG